MDDVTRVSPSQISMVQQRELRNNSQLAITNYRNMNDVVASGNQSVLS